MAAHDGLDIDIATRVGALDLEVRLTVAEGALALVGPNGAGKSTTLLCVLGVHRPRSGRVALGDRALFDAAEGIDVATEDRGFGYVPQHNALFPHLTAAGNVAFALACRPAVPGATSARRGRRDRRDRAIAALDALGVAHVADRMPATLSGGEAQRVAIARALAAEPAALLLDEPFAALDARARPALRERLAQTLAELGRPAVIVTHDLADAEALAPRIAVMERGHIAQVGRIDTLRTEPATPFVARLVASPGGAPW